MVNRGAGVYIYEFRTKDLLDSSHRPKVPVQRNGGNHASRKVALKKSTTDQLLHRRQGQQKNQHSQLAKTSTEKKRKMSNRSRSKDTMKVLKLQTKKGNRQQGDERETTQKKRKVTFGKKDRDYSSCAEEFSSEEEESFSEAEEEENEELTRNPQQKLTSRNTLGFRGVHRQENKYQAKIRIDGSIKYLGSFDTTTKAALAYDRAVIKNKLPSSWLNFVHKK